MYPILNSCPLRAYKDIFGEPGKGVHKYRIFDIAIADVLVVVLLGVFIAWVSKISIWIVLPVLFLFGIIVHRLVCVRTKLDKILFP